MSSCSFLLTDIVELIENQAVIVEDSPRWLSVTVAPETLVTLTRRVVRLNTSPLTVTSNW